MKWNDHKTVLILFLPKNTVSVEDSFYKNHMKLEKR